MPRIQAQLLAGPPDGTIAFFSLQQSNIHTTTQRYLQPPFVVSMCVSGHCAPQPRFSYAHVWVAYDM
jgi:hypothetical protein